MSAKNVMRALAGTAGVLLVAGAAGPGAAAAVTAEDTGDVQATVRKTVLQTASPTGEILTSRMYTQVSAVGKGTKTVVVPVGTTSNRNLNSFGDFPMEGEAIVFDLTVEGGTEERTLTDADLSPIAVSVKVLLDGVEIQPEDVVGASGVLDVQYTVRNTTATTEAITFTDVQGNEITEDVETADPFVGSLDVTLPKGFNEVTAPGATVAGNGQNQTSLGYSFVLFPPLGAAEVTVGYQARIDDGVMPPADFSFLPIVPYDNSTIAGTAEAYKGGAAVGEQIFGAGQEIGENLLKLQAGAGELVAGLGQLSAGAVQISDGLVNTAAPGAAALAEGSGDVSDGVGELNAQIPALADGTAALDAGANLVSDGLNELDSKVPALEDGAQQLDDGAQQLSGGLDQLNSQVPVLEDGAADLDAGAQQLAAGMVDLTAGLELLADPATGIPAAAEGAEALAAGAEVLSAGMADLVAGLTGAGAGATDLADGLPVAKGGVDQVKAGLDTAVSTGIPQLQGGVGVAAATPGCAGDAVCTGTLGAVSGGLDLLLDETALAAGGLGQVSAGLADAIVGADALAAGINQLLLPGAQELQAGVDGQLVPGLNQLVGGLTAASAGITQALAGSQQLTAGAELLAEGTAALNASVPAFAAGIDQLATGAGDLADGTEALNEQVPTLAAGVSELAAGGEVLAEGTGELDAKVPGLASGVEQLDEGAALVADGNQDLSDGLGAAADGSEDLVDGLASAEPGGAQLEQGAGDLKEQGADELAKTGQEAQLGYAVNVAQLEAAQQAGQEGAGLPYGEATGTDTVTTAALQMQLAGIAPATDNNALKYGLGVVLIAGAGGAAYAARRKVAA